uniref:Transcription factor E2F7 n=1 Tax=Sphaeramia orbicularis TaxID=375764 RepID=A0A673CU35_9TELE
QMEVECLALKDLSSPIKSFSENVCIDRRRSTPLKTTETSIPALLANRKGATPELMHITPSKHTPLNEPWTPTANLKMLISAASPDIRDREMKKVLFRPIENEKDKPASPNPVAEDTEMEDSCQVCSATDGMEKKPSRKQKSLGLLCQKFLALYPDYPPLHSPIWISLDKVATNLGVERRRIYDIVNVLESLMIVGRMAKNSYTWYGRRRLEAMLKELQCRGRQQGYHLQMELATEAKDVGSTAGNRKDKSLRIMSQKFVMLFLVSKTQTVTLDAAAKILIEESQDSSSHSKYKTKVRRLYDIANVLTSLSLIKKVHVREERGRKPAFKWLGPVEFSGSGNSAVTAPEATQQPMTGQDLRRAKMVRHASFNITPISVLLQYVCSIHWKYTPVDYSRKTTVCRLQFGSSTEAEHLREAEDCSPTGITRMSPTYPAGHSQEQGLNKSPVGVNRSKPTQPSHYLYVPNNAGLNSLNFFLSAGQSPAGLALPSNSVPTLALPYVLVPSAAISHYPLVASSLQQQGSDAQTKLSFSLPAVMPPTHFMVGAAPYGLAVGSEVNESSAPVPSTPEQTQLYGTPHSPLGPRQSTPHTPKENMASASKSFFQTPATPGSVVSTGPAVRKRGSVQRRLDVGHPPNK